MLTLDHRHELLRYARPYGRARMPFPMLMTAEPHRRLAEIYEEAAADRSHTPEYRAFLLEKVRRFR